MLHPSFSWGLLIILSLLSVHNSLFAQPFKTIDLANTSTNNGTLLRVFGHTGSGSSGLPVAGGFDVDGDGFNDYAVAAMLASPNSRNQAGEVYLIFGDGTINGTIDTGAPPPARQVTILGAAQQEHAGSEIWMDDVTGDGLGDLLICRQDHTPGGVRTGAGALTIINGAAQLRNLTEIDLAGANPSVTITTIIGAAVQDRLCIWLRTGDVDGDGIADIVVGADQAEPDGIVEDLHYGEVYVIRGGAHLAANQTVDLANFGSLSPPLSGNLLRINPPSNANHFHLGATVQIGDLDGDNRAEILAAAALNRSGAGLQPLNPPGRADPLGGTINGTLYIIWDDDIPPVWPANFELTLNSNDLPSQTTISGSNENSDFGEEILAGLDYDGDNNADLFVGDLTGSPAQVGNFAGIADIFFNAATLKGQSIVLNNPPGGLIRTRFHGPQVGGITADTAMHGDFSGDGIDDLAFSSPTADPFGRGDAGTLHVVLGQTGSWPTLVNLQPALFPPASQIRIIEVYGANGAAAGDRGDTLSYSGAYGDINNDGVTDIITNEMIGNGVNAIDVGNLIILNGLLFEPSLFIDQFESP